MKIRDARVRDAVAIANIIPESEAINDMQIMGMIQKNDPKVYVATDFSANILACALGKDKVFVSSNCAEAGVEDELKAMY